KNCTVFWLDNPHPTDADGEILGQFLPHVLPAVVGRHDFDHQVWSNFEKAFRRTVWPALLGQKHHVGSTHTVRLTSSIDTYFACHHPTEVVFLHKVTQNKTEIGFYRAMFTTGWTHGHNSPIHKLAWTDVTHGEQFLTSDQWGFGGRRDHIQALHYYDC